MPMPMSGLAAQPRRAPHSVAASAARSVPLPMPVAALLFSLMGACVQLASARCGTGEIVMYRSLVGAGLDCCRPRSWEPA